MAGHPAEARPARDGARPVSVLLAEHEPEVAVMSARFLSRDGLRVRLVTRPDQALAELTGGPDAAAGGPAATQPEPGGGWRGRSARASWSRWCARYWPRPDRPA